MAFGLDLRAGDHVESVDAVIFVGGGLGRRVALALLGHDMDEHRAVGQIAHVLQDGQQMVEIMAVDRPDIEEAELLEQSAAGPEAAAEFFGAPRLLEEEFRQALGELLGRLADRAIGLARHQPRQIGRHRAGRRRDRHVVVVENDDQARMQRAGVVHRLIGHARRHRAVADHRDDMIVALRKIARHRHAEPGRNRGRGMRRAERIIFALRPLGEAGKAARLAQSADAVAPAGQDFMRIGLVPDVPDDAVARRVENIMERQRQLDDAEPGPEMAPVTETALIVSARN